MSPRKSPRQPPRASSHGGGGAGRGILVWLAFALVVAVGSTLLLIPKFLRRAERATADVPISVPPSVPATVPSSDPAHESPRFPHSKKPTSNRASDVGAVIERQSIRESQVCAECHGEIVANYARSGMSHTWSPDVAAIVAPRRAVAEVTDGRSGYLYAVSFEGGGLTQTESHPAYPRHRLRHQASFVIGSGKHAQAMGCEENGYLTVLPVAWFAVESVWRLNPGYELKNHRFDRPITPGCVACHSTEAKHRSPSTNRFRTPIAAGIECRRCHGNGDSHVAFWHGTTDGAGGAPPASARLIDPGKLATDRAHDVCLQCHLQGDVTLFEPKQDALTFQPGQRLRDQRHDFLIARDDPAALGVASHGARLLRSRCYLESEGRLTCLTCHDPHRPARDTSAREYDAKCAACHQPEACSRPLIANRDEDNAVKENRSTAGCVTCHMPRRSSREGIHLVFTDHAIVRNKPAAPADVEREERVTGANSVLPANCDFELVSCWPEDVPTDRTLGAAYVLAHESMGPQLQALRRARPLLQHVVDQDPDDLESRFWLGAAQLGLGDGQAAVGQLKEVVRRQPSHMAARFRLAAAYELAGDYRSAVALYESLLRDVPDWMEPYPRLAQLYLYGQRPSVASELLQRQLSWREDATALAQLGLAQGLSGESQTRTLATAMATIERSLALDPRNPTAYVNRAALHLLSGRNDLARADFEQVLLIEPTHAQAVEALKRLPATPEPPPR